MPANINYVKFMRGTQSLYNSLAIKDQDTLYFVYENIGDDHGKLYLGNKLISGSSSNLTGDISLADIADIAIDAGLSDGQVLAYDAAEDKWVNVSITEAIGMSEMVGASAATDGVAGLVPVPHAGDQLKFLRGDGSWQTVVAELSAQDQQAISNLQSTVATIIDTDTNMSIREIAASELAAQLIPANAEESLDTLQEIAQWIQDHPDDASAMSEDITILQTQVGNLNSLLNDQDGLIDRVESLESTIGTFTPVQGSYLNVGSAISYLNTSVTEINDRLRWHELSE